MAMVAICEREHQLPLCGEQDKSHCAIVIMILRVYALYRGNIWILSALLVVFTGQIVLQGAALLQGIRKSSLANDGPCSVDMCFSRRPAAPATGWPVYTDRQKSVFCRVLGSATHDRHECIPPDVMEDARIRHAPKTFQYAVSCRFTVDYTRVSLSIYPTECSSYLFAYVCLLSE